MPLIVEAGERVMEEHLPYLEKLLAAPAGG
jgi:hypothetical protein